MTTDKEKSATAASKPATLPLLLGLAALAVLLAVGVIGSRTGTPTVPSPPALTTSTTTTGSGTTSTATTGSASTGASTTTGSATTTTTTQATPPST